MALLTNSQYLPKIGQWYGGCAQSQLWAGRVRPEVSALTNKPWLVIPLLGPWSPHL